MIDRWIQRRGALTAAGVALYFALSATMARIMPSYLHDVLTWNLFLALLPLAFALFAHRSRRRWFTAICSVCWLLFFPNAPYLATDLMHVHFLHLWGNESAGMFARLEPWVALMHLAAGVFLGTMAGMLSLRIMHLKMEARLGNTWPWPILLFISALSGYAIYMGRYLRVNSWDALHRPLLLWEQFVASLNVHSLLLSTLFAAYVFGAYVIFLLFSPQESAAQ